METVENVKKKISKRRCLVFVIIAVIISLFPIYGKIIDHEYQMNGVSSTEVEVPVNFHSLWKGTAQSALEDKLKMVVPGRATLIRVHSQFLYSVFNCSSNSNVVIGGRHSLYEPEYLCDFLNIWPQMSEEAMDGLISNLETLQSLLAQNGKKLYIFITPSKVRYDYPNIPMAYRMLTKPKMSTNYDRFVKKLETTSIGYFDSIDYIDNNMDDDSIFYSSGIHWSNAAAAQVTEAMLKDMEEDTGYNLGSLTINLVDSETGLHPDQDLLSTLNLYHYHKEDDYRVPEFNYSPGTDHPNVLMRGGSFMGQTLSKLMDLGAFGKNVYFQNNLVIDNGEVRILSDFNAYDEISITEMLNMADFVILEVNEEKIWTMSWGFIDELISALQNGTGEPIIQFIGEKSVSEAENPWGISIGYIDYHDNEGILLTTPLDNKIQMNMQNCTGILSFDVEIHDWVRMNSDGCTLILEVEGEETSELEYFIPGGTGENTPIHLTIPLENVDQVSISYCNPQGTTADCDWVVISNISVD